jgi:quercetin dioxygenase-like cupin family protein
METKMIQRYLVLATVLAVFSFVGTQSSASEDGEMMVTGLLNMPLEGIADVESNVVLFEVGPNWSIGNHFHPGHIFLYMLEGSITIEVDGQEARTLSPGEVVYEVPNMNMVGSNASSTEGARFLVFTVGDIGDDVTVFVE